MTLFRALALAAASALALFAGAQSLPPSAAASVPAQAAATAAPVEFDTISIHRFVPTGRYEACGLHSDPIRLHFVNCPLLSMLRRANGFEDYQIESRGASWITDDLYDVDARAAAPASAGQMLAMLRNALTQRFHVQSRTDHRDIPAYLLERVPRRNRLQPAIDTAHCGEVALRPGILRSDCVSADDIAGGLQMILSLGNSGGAVRPVRNDTGLPQDARYRIDLEFAASDAASDGPSIFTALPEQLGLRLATGKIPADVLVILSAQRPGGD